MQAIILAGGFGTRLRSVISNVPKPMAPINGKPFLAYLLDNLKVQGFKHIVLSVHYLREQIQDYFKDHYHGLSISYAIEKIPLGTGGAIVNSLQCIDNDEPCFVLNGDTFVKLNYLKMYSSCNNLTIALRTVMDCSRYGQAIVDDNSNIIEFQERGTDRQGLINTGVYLLNKILFSHYALPKSFSFEKDFLFKNLNIIQPKAFIADDYFIDIGVPEDYARAAHDFQGL